MKNTVELQLRALRPPRILKQTDAGVPEFVDVWAIHHNERSPGQWAIAVKFGRDMAEPATEIKTGTLFTVKGRLDQSKNLKTGAWHTFVWAEEIFDLVPSRKPHPEPAGSEAPPVSREDKTPEMEFPDPAQDEENPEPEVPHA